MRLIFQSGPRAGQTVEIDGALTIGRVDDNDVHLADEKVSRHHAVIEQRGDGRLVVRDLGSHNGTFVDGVRLSQAHILSGGEELRFGDQRLQVEPMPAPQGVGAPTVTLRPDRAPAPAPRAAAPPKPVVVKAHAQRPPVLEPPAQADAPPTAAQRATPRKRGLPRIGRRGAFAAAAVVLVVLVIGLAQLLLPGFAEHKLRSDLSRHGKVQRLDISATPAITLLWHHADRVQVAMDRYRSEHSGHASIGDFLSRTRAASKLDVRVGTITTQLLTLHKVHLRKDGDALVGSARLSQSELTKALPSYFHLRLIRASKNGILLRASAKIAGVRAGVRLRVTADNGHVIVRPEDLPFGSLATITVFKDPRVYVQSLGAKQLGDGYRLTARARLQ